MNTCTMHGMRLGAILLLAACSKSEGGGTATAVPTEAPTIAITGTPQPPASASAIASASAVASASAPAPASASAPALASASPAKPPPSAKAAALVASASPAKPDTTPLKPASTRITGKNFTLDVASPGCRVDVPCAVTLRVVAANEFHVNKEYPYKFTATAAPGVQFLGNGDANTFSRASGDFREDGEKGGTMTVRFKPSSAGEARVSGSYKMSVCSAEQCQIETQAVTLAVPVSER